MHWGGPHGAALNCLIYSVGSKSPVDGRNPPLQSRVSYSVFDGRRIIPSCSSFCRFGGLLALPLSTKGHQEENSKLTACLEFVTLTLLSRAALFCVRVILRPWLPITRGYLRGGVLVKRFVSVVMCRVLVR